MKRSSNTGMALTLLLASAMASRSMAVDFAVFTAEISILNETPYTLELVEHSIVKSNYRGKFMPSQEFADKSWSIQPTDLVRIGMFESRKEGIEGHFIFKFTLNSENVGENSYRNTGKHFDAHYRFATNKDGDTWFRLLDDNGRAYALASAHMIRTCEVNKNSLGTSHHHKGSIVIFTDDVTEACINDRSCLAETFKDSPAATKGHLEF